jgi:hypothetical protein
MDILDKINGMINEKSQDADVVKVAGIIKGGVALMGLRTPLEGIFNKKDIDFVLSPVAHFRIKTKKGTLIIVNKKYADDAEEVVGELAIGYEGKI